MLGNALSVACRSVSCVIRPVAVFRPVAGCQRLPLAIPLHWNMFQRGRCCGCVTYASCDQAWARLCRVGYWALSDTRATRWR
jgi:hypothetical protein